MKERQRLLLNAVLESQGTTPGELMERFAVSRRTLYYDIEQLNDQLGNVGKLQNINRRITFQGSMEGVRKLLLLDVGNPADYGHRRRYILREMMREEPITVEQLAEQLDISKNTVVQAIEDIRLHLRELTLSLEYKQYYAVVGDEIAIRSLYISLMREDGKTLHEIGGEVLDFNRQYALNLTDFGLSFLHKLLCFVRPRISRGLTLTTYSFMSEVEGFQYYSGVPAILPLGASPAELAYLTAFIATLPSLNQQTDIELVNEYIDYLTDEFEVRADIPLRNREDFLKNIRRHLQSSYYRIKFRFPVYTPVMAEIRLRHGHLHKIIRGIIQEDVLHPEFSNMRDEEIYFITAYFGAYMTSGIPKRVLIVCPSGLMISKSLELQLCRFIPGIRIVGSSSISSLSDYTGEYDYIVSTIPISGHSPVLVVSPLLTRPDICMLMETLVDLRITPQVVDMERVMSIIGENCIIHDEQHLYNQLLRELFRMPN